MYSKFTIIFILVQFQLSLEDGSYTAVNPFRFPYGPIQGPFMGMFLALTMPLDLPEYNVFFSYNFEANYAIPSNDSSFTWPPLISKRSWDRRFIYDILEAKLKMHGFSGKDCLLRTICEASQHSFQNTGILGDLIHIVLTPSTSIDNISNEYQKAEHYGRTKNNCNKYVKKCKISLLNLISWIGSYLKQ